VWVPVLHAVRVGRRAARAPFDGAAGVAVSGRRGAERKSHPRHEPHADVWMALAPVIMRTNVDKLGRVRERAHGVLAGRGAGARAAQLRRRGRAAPPLHRRPHGMPVRGHCILFEVDAMVQQWALPAADLSRRSEGPLTRYKGGVYALRRQQRDAPSTNY
jgi:hypothetical protein